MNHKESLHFTTPSYSYKEKISPDIKKIVQDWADISQDLGLDFIEHLSTIIFKCNKATLAHRADLPVAFGEHKTMLDIAYYKNDKTATLSPDVGLSTEVILFILNVFVCNFF